MELKKAIALSKNVQDILSVVRKKYIYIVPMWLTDQLKIIPVMIFVGLLVFDMQTQAIFHC